MVILKKLTAYLEARRIVSICNTYTVDLGKLHLFCIFTLVDHVKLTNHVILWYTSYRVMSLLHELRVSFSIRVKNYCLLLA